MNLRLKFFWQIGFLRSLLETALLGILLLGVIARLEGYAQPMVFYSATLFFCGACGMWAVLRARLPEGSWLSQTGWEMAMAAAISLLMLVGLQLVANLLGWTALWRLAPWDVVTTDVLLFLTGVGYFLARLGVRIWLLWDRLRRTRMRWALTHAHLLIVILAAVIGAVALFLLAPYSELARATVDETIDPFAQVITNLLVTAFPAVSIVTILTIIALAVLLPPSAVFSYLVARQTTKRLEALAKATTALRGGNYRERVAIKGEDEVARLQGDFNAMADQLEQTLSALQAERDRVAELLQARRELVAAVSHELRTPVATLRAAIETAITSIPPSRDTDEGEINRNLDVLSSFAAQNIQISEFSPPLSPALGEEKGLREYLGVMENEILRLQRLIDDLFTFARADANALALNCQPTDVLAAIRQAVAAHAPLAWNTARLEISTDLPEQLPLALVDETRLQQILANLLRNAVRHTPPGGVVAVLACIDGDWLRLDVRDTGEGIALDDLPHIWERFYRGKNADNARGDSAGLGLALVKELVEAMGGRVGVESVEEQGSSFSVWLPKV